ncbi:MAG: hypothetical protein WC480_01145 [Patescibacteria group bacterium]
MLETKIKKGLVNFNSQSLKSKIVKISKLSLPDFVTHRPDLNQLQQIARRYNRFSKIVLIANGGSRNTALAFYQSLALERNSKELFFVSSGQPDYLTAVKKQCPPRQTLVLVISESGTNINNIEPYLAFINYPTLVITENSKGVIYQIAQKRHLQIVKHPVMSGRFSGRTSCALLPAALTGLDIKKINQGAVSGYKKHQRSALGLASYLYLLYQKQYQEIFVSVYSSYITGFLPLLVQLIHESTGKAGRGFTIFGDGAPESHHHTNQRFFGGQQNVIGLFILQDDYLSGDNLKIKVPTDFKKIDYRGGKLGDLNGLFYKKGLLFDFLGVQAHADKKNLPYAIIRIKKWDEQTAGEFLAFIQLVTYYLCLLLGVNPFDQPEVEYAKQVGWELRKRYGR